MIINQKYSDAVITKYVAPTNTKPARIRVRDISGKYKYFSYEYSEQPRKNHEIASRFALEYRGYKPDEWQIISAWLPDNTMSHVFIQVIGN